MIVENMTRIKPWLIKLHLYRIARFAYRHLIYRQGLRQLEEQKAFFSTFVKPGDLCFDIGANRGTKSEALLLLGAQVVAVEPLPGCAVELRERLGHFPLFTCVEAAVGAAEGSAVLNVSEVDLLSSTRPDWFGQSGRWAASIPVALTTLDALIKNYGIPKYCKIDVEGSELEVLEGLSRRIANISFEFHTGNGHIEAAAACLARLMTVGPFIANITRQEAAVFCGDWVPWAGFDAHFRAVLSRDEAFEYGEIFVRYPT